MRVTLIEDIDGLFGRTNLATRPALARILSLETLADGVNKLLRQSLVAEARSEASNLSRNVPQFENLR
jgi:hypothetical protein